MNKIEVNVRTPEGKFYHRYVHPDTTFAEFYDSLEGMHPRIVTYTCEATGKTITEEVIRFLCSGSQHSSDTKFSKFDKDFITLDLIVRIRGS